MFKMETKVSTQHQSQHDAKLPVVGSASRQVMYLHSLAFTTCDCGEPLTMAQTIYADPTYKGECKCGKIMKLRNGRMWQS